MKCMVIIKEQMLAAGKANPCSSQVPKPMLVLHFCECALKSGSVWKKKSDVIEEKGTHKTALYLA